MVTLSISPRFVDVLFPTRIYVYHVAGYRCALSVVIQVPQSSLVALSTALSHCYILVFGPTNPNKYKSESKSGN